MTEATSYAPPLNLLDRIATGAAFALVGGLFYTVGWMVIDPMGAATLLNHGSMFLAVIKLACLAGLGSTLASVLLRAHVADVGLLAVAVGLAAMASRGTGVDSLMRFPPGDMTRSAVMAALAGETLGWLVAVAVAAAVGERVAKWFSPDGAKAYGPDHIGLRRLLIGRAARRWTKPNCARAWGVC